MAHVPFGQRHLARWLHAVPSLQARLADLETAVLGDAVTAVQPGAPVWICGMARAGSTILLEFLNDAPGFTAHQYADYPWLWTPYWRNWLRARLPGAGAVASERAHGDRLQVTPASPEAFEEMFWMHHFANRHDPAISQVLDGGTSNPAFERFFDAHQRKLLLARGARRYLGKANYQFARLGYLHRLYPQARFVIPVRDPIAQVQSLLQQDRRFRQLHDEDAAVGSHLARIGHFEFGPHKRAFHLGDADATRAIAEDFTSDRLEAGYARQWTAQYGFAERLIHTNPSLARACLWVGYERLCADPAAELARIAAHVGVGVGVGVDDDARAALLARWSGRISAPDAPAAAPALDDIVAPITATTWHAIQPLLD